MSDDLIVTTGGCAANAAVAVARLGGVARFSGAVGVPVVLDCDRATALDDPLFALASYVIFSAEALAATTGLADLAAGLRQVAGTLCCFLSVTNGPDDVLWFDAGEVRRAPAFAIDAVDSLGAGDAYHGGFALAVAEGRDTLSAMQFAAAAAGLKCTRFGGISGAA